VDSAPQPAAGQAANATTAPEAPEAPADEVAPIDLMASAGPAVLKRLAPVALLLAGLALLIILRRRRG
jgi:hypothetical protein